MSYDLMVFEPSAAPRARPQFMEWYKSQTKWSEDHDYNNPEVCSTALQSWFKEMIKFFPPMNGPFATDDVDDPRMTDYCVGRNVIYSAFAWSCAEDARAKMKELAVKHEVGFFEVSATDGELFFPGDSIGNQRPTKPGWKFW